MRSRRQHSGFSLVTGACVVMALASMTAYAEEPGLSAARVAKAKQCFADAQAAYDRGQLSQARDGFRCAYDIAPSPELAWNLGRVHERMGEAAESVRLYELYLAASPKDAPERKDVERRIAELKALAERQQAQLRETLPSQADLSKEARTFFQRGVKLYQQRRYAAALAAFTAALRANDAPELRYNLALTSERLGELQDALDHYRAYLAAVPDAVDHAAVSAHVDELRSQLRR